jgi:hypothetical protein
MAFGIQTAINEARGMAPTPIESHSQALAKIPTSLLWP